jgi:glycosyltransferase involved in cell wall biosynthesis
MLSVVLYSMRGGVETYTLQLANALSSIARVAYAIDANKLALVDGYIDKRVTLLEYKRPRRRELLGVVEMKRLAGEIKRFKPDAFHLQGDGVWESVLLRFLTTVPVINTVHDPIKHVDQRTFLNNWTMKDAVGKSCGWVVHSEGLKKIFIERNQVGRERVLVHPHGVYDFYANYAQASSDKEKFILFFGRLRANKGADLFLEAFDKVKDQIPGWRVVVAGRGSFANSKLYEKNRHRITFHNHYVSDAEAADLFSKAGITVLPYRHGSQSGVLALAAAFACPVLATSVGNIPEILTDRQHALLVEPGNIGALANGLVEIATNDKLRITLGNNLGILAHSEWSWKEIAEKTLQFYTQCIEKDVYDWTN